LKPEQIKALRHRFGYTQAAFSEVLGLAELSISQYETGYRKPGPTLLILFRVLDSLPDKKALWILKQFESHSISSEQNNKGAGK